MKKIVTLVCAGFLLSGCVTASEVDTLIPQNLQQITSQSKLSGSVSVTEASKEHESAFSSQISDKALNDALREALSLNGMLSNAMGDYAVQASLVHLDQPMVGLDMKVTSKVQYLVKDKTGKIVMDRNVSAEYTAKMGDAFVGATRVKRANEGSIRENISKFISVFSAWADTNTVG